MRTTYVGLAAAALVLVASAGPSTPPAYERIDRDGEPLRSTFNADAGKVRVVMLVAPT